LKIKRVLIPALSLIIVLTAAAFWLAGCTSLQVLNATVSHRKEKWCRSDEVNQDTKLTIKKARITPRLDD
jgi:hypothetical protein